MHSMHAFSTCVGRPQNINPHAQGTENGLENSDNKSKSEKAITAQAAYAALQKLESRQKEKQNNVKLFHSSPPERKQKQKQKPTTKAKTRLCLYWHTSGRKTYKSKKKKKEGKGGMVQGGAWGGRGGVGVLKAKGGTH